MFVSDEAEALRLDQANHSERMTTKSSDSRAMRDAQTLLEPDVSCSDADNCRDSFLDDFDRPRKRTAFVDSTPGSQHSNLQPPAHWPTPSSFVTHDNRQNTDLEHGVRCIPSIPSLAALLKLYPCSLHALQTPATLQPTAAAQVPGAGTSDIATLLLLARIAAPMQSTPAEPAATAAITTAAIWTSAAAALAQPAAGWPPAWHVVPATFVTAPPRHLAATAAAAPPPMRWWAAAPEF